MIYYLAVPVTYFPLLTYCSVFNLYLSPRSSLPSCDFSNSNITHLPTFKRLKQSTLVVTVNKIKPSYGIEFMIELSHTLRSTKSTLRRDILY